MTSVEEKRDNIRLVGIVEVDIGNRRYAASNVSESGFALIGDDAKWSAGMEVDARIMFVTREGQTDIDCSAKLVRRASGLSGFMYSKLSEADMDRLQILLSAQGALSSA